MTSGQFSFGAVLVAGGSGSRLGAQQPKQFLPLNGYRLYIWSISKLYKNELIDKIVLTAPASYVEEIRRELARLMPGKIIVIAGGATRQESVYKGLEKLVELGKPDYVLIHDAARPFVSSKIIDDAIETVTTRGACTVATPVADTLKEVELDKICQTINREKIFAVQTPQAAPFDLLWQCHQEAAAKQIGVTDDAAILEHFGHPVVIFPGSNTNIKVTVLDDLRACELLAPLYLADTPL